MVPDTEVETAEALDRAVDLMLAGEDWTAASDALEVQAAEEVRDLMQVVERLTVVGREMPAVGALQPGAGRTSWHLRIRRQMRQMRQMRRTLAEFNVSSPVLNAMGATSVVSTGAMVAAMAARRAGVA